MFKLLAIQFTLFILLMISCNNVDEVVKEPHSSNEPTGNYISSIIFLNGGDLHFTQYSRGCVNEETQRMEMSKTVNKQIVISYFKNDIKVLDRKVFDSSFLVYIKSFLNECDKLLKDTSSKEIGFGTIETIEISDGLDIIEVGAGVSKQRNPFNDLVYTICSKAENRMILDR